jgi:hypothetical protein
MVYKVRIVVWQLDGMQTTAVVNRRGCHFTSIKFLLTKARDLCKETTPGRKKCL